MCTRMHKHTKNTKSEIIINKQETNNIKMPKQHNDTKYLQNYQ